METEQAAIVGRDRPRVTQDGGTVATGRATTRS
jgi:hypothetical protein